MVYGKGNGAGRGPVGTAIANRGRDSEEKGGLAQAHVHLPQESRSREHRGSTNREVVTRMGQAQGAVPTLGMVT